MSERTGVLAALTSSTLGGTIAATTRFVVADVDPLTLGALRFGGAFLVLLPVVVALRQPWPKGRDWLWVVLLGGVYFCVYQVLYNVAFVYTTAAHGSMIGSMLALMTMVVAALFGVERLSGRKTAGVLIATGGVAIALATGLAAAPQGAWRGDLVMLAGIFCWACYNIWSRPFIARSSPLTFLIGGMGVGAAGLLALVLWRGGLGAVAALRPGQFAAVGYMALFATPVALWLWIFALNRATPTRVASTMAMHPVGASILAAIIVGEPIGLNLALGVIAVLAGIWIATREGASPEQKNEQGQSPARIS
jgi:drug/metabolite transporter (DMT)-like permease